MNSKDEDKIMNVFVHRGQELRLYHIENIMESKRDPNRAFQWIRLPSEELARLSEGASKQGKPGTLSLVESSVQAGWTIPIFLDP
ncbi:hypothetical protein ACOME3_008869 [Neoechinorhynchus agilis]